jgi:lysophospholipase L1-like esterase
MAIDPKLVEIVSVDQLQNEINPLNAKVLIYNGEDRLKTTPLASIKAEIVTGIKGEAVPSTVPTPWTSGDPDLYEKYDIKTAGTYTNFKDASNASIVVSSGDLVSNLVQIWVKNGVSQKVITDLPTVPVIDGFTSSSTTDASSAKNAKILNDIITSNFVPKYTYVEFYDSGTVQNGYYNASGVFTANADFKATPKTNVVAGATWRYRGKPYTSLSINGVYGFRANGTIVVLVGIVNAVNFVEFTIPSDVIQIGANYNVSTGTYFNLQRVDVTQVLVSITKDTLGNVQTINNENLFKTFTGKSIASIGDSITANGVGGSLKGYQLVLQDYYSFTTYTTYGYSGQPLSTYITPNGATIIEMFINNAVSKDIYTLLAGTNDFRLGMRNGEIGTITDYKNLTSYGSVGSVVSLNFYQALKAFVLRCYELNPKAKIIFITPPQRDNAGYTSWSTNPVGRTLSDFVNAIKEVAAYESIPVVDLFREGVINIRNISQYTSDGLHPNNDGYVLLGNLMKPAINKVI